MGNALTTVFILIIGEDWNWTMYEWVRAFGDGSTMNEILATLFFIILMIVGNIVLFSVFTAILLQNFEGGDDDEDGEDEHDVTIGQNNGDNKDDHDNTDLKPSLTRRLCGKDAREKYVYNFKMAFGGKERKVRHDASDDAN